MSADKEAIWAAQLKVAKDTKDKKKQKELLKLKYPPRKNKLERQILEGDAKTGKVPLNCMNCDQEFDNGKHFPIVLPLCACPVAKCYNCVKEDLWASPKAYYGSILCPKCEIKIDNKLICKNSDHIAEYCKSLVDDAIEHFNMRISSRNTDSVKKETFFPLLDKFRDCGFKIFTPENKEMESVERVKITIASLELMRRECQVLEITSKKVVMPTSAMTVSVNAFDSECSDDVEGSEESDYENGSESECMNVDKSSNPEYANEKKSGKIIYDATSRFDTIQKKVFDGIELNKNTLLYSACLDQSGNETEIRRNHKDEKVVIDVKCAICLEDIEPNQSVLKTCGCKNPICRVCCLRNIGNNGRVSYDEDSSNIYYVVDCPTCDGLGELKLHGNTIENAINDIKGSVLKIRTKNENFFKIMRELIEGARKFYLKCNPSLQGKKLTERLLYCHYKQMNYIAEHETLLSDAEVEFLESDHKMKFKGPPDLKNKLKLIVCRLEERRCNIKNAFKDFWICGVDESEKQKNIKNYILENPLELGPLAAIELKTNFIIEYYVDGYKKSALKADECDKPQKVDDSDQEPELEPESDQEQDSENGDEESIQGVATTRTMTEYLGNVMDQDDDNERVSKSPKKRKPTKRGSSNDCWFADCYKTYKKKEDLRAHLNKSHRTKCLETNKLAEVGLIQCSKCDLYTILGKSCTQCGNIADENEYPFIEDEIGFFDSNHIDHETHRLVDHFKIVRKDTITGDYCPCSLLNMLSSCDGGETKGEFFLEGQLWFKQPNAQKISCLPDSLSFDSWLIYSPGLNKCNTVNPIVENEHDRHYKLTFGDILLLKNFNRANSSGRSSFRVVYILKKPSQDYKFGHFNPHFGEVTNNSLKKRTDFRGLYMPLVEAIFHFLDYKTEDVKKGLPEALLELASLNLEQLMEAKLADGMSIKSKVSHFNYNAVKRIETLYQLAMYHLFPKDSKLLADIYTEPAIKTLVAMDTSDSHTSHIHTSNAAATFDALAMLSAEAAPTMREVAILLSSDDDDEVVPIPARFPKRKIINDNSNDDSNLPPNSIARGHARVSSEDLFSKYEYGTKDNPLIMEIASLPLKNLQSEEDYEAEYLTKDNFKRSNGELDIWVKISNTLQNHLKAESLIQVNAFILTNLFTLAGMLKQKNGLAIGEHVIFRRKENKEIIDKNATLASLNASSTTSFFLTKEIIKKDIRAGVDIISRIAGSGVVGFSTSETGATSIGSKSSIQTMSSHSDSDNGHSDSAPLTTGQKNMRMLGRKNNFVMQKQTEHQSIQRPSGSGVIFTFGEEITKEMQHQCPVNDSYSNHSTQMQPTGAATRPQDPRLRRGLDSAFSLGSSRLQPSINEQHIVSTENSNSDHMSKKIKTEPGLEEISFTIDYGNGRSIAQNSPDMHQSNIHAPHTDMHGYGHAAVYLGAGGSESTIRGGDDQVYIKSEHLSSSNLISASSEPVMSQSNQYVDPVSLRQTAVIKSETEQPLIKKNMSEAEVDLLFRRKIFENIDFKSLNPFVMIVHAPHISLPNDEARYKAEKDLRNKYKNERHEKLTCKLRVWFSPRDCVSGAPVIGIDYLEAPLYVASLNGNLEQLANAARQQLAVDYECKTYRTPKNQHLQKSRSLAWFGISNNWLVEIFPESLPKHEVKMPGWKMPQLRREVFVETDRMRISPAEVKVESDKNESGFSRGIGNGMHTGSDGDVGYDATRDVNSPLTEDDNFYEDETNANIDSSSDIDSVLNINRRKTNKVVDIYAVEYVPKNVDDGERPPEKARDPNKKVEATKVTNCVVVDLNDLNEVADADDDDYSEDTDEGMPNPNAKKETKTNVKQEKRPSAVAKNSQIVDVESKRGDRDSRRRDGRDDSRERNRNEQSRSRDRNDRKHRSRSRDRDRFCNKSVGGGGAGVGSSSKSNSNSNSNSSISNSDSKGWDNSKNSSCSGWGNSSHNNNNSNSWGNSNNSSSSSGWGNNNNNNRSWGNSNNSNNNSSSSSRWGNSNNNNSSGWGNSRNSNSSSWGNSNNNKSSSSGSSNNNDGSSWGNSNNKNSSSWGNSSNNNSSSWGNSNNNNSSSSGKSNSNNSNSNSWGNSNSNNSNSNSWGNSNNNNNNNKSNNNSNNNNSNSWGGDQARRDSRERGAGGDDRDRGRGGGNSSSNRRRSNSRERKTESYVGGPPRWGN